MSTTHETSELIRRVMRDHGYANAQELSEAKEHASTGAAADAATITTLTTARDNALAGLPAAINAVPIESFAALVFAPAKAAAQRAGCGDSYYSSDGYVSYTFNLGRFCA